MDEDFEGALQDVQQDEGAESGACSSWVVIGYT